MAIQRDPRHAQFAERLLHQVQAHHTLKAPCFYLNPDNSLEGVRHLLVMTVHPIYRREVMASASRLLAGRYGPMVLVWGGRST